MLFSKRKKVSKTENIDSIPGIEKECVEALRELGYENVSSLQGKDAEEMYYKLSAIKGSVQKKELLYGFRCAIYYATVKKADPKKLHWCYWKDSTANDEIIDVETLLEMYKQMQ